MIKQQADSVIIVKSKTRLESLKERFNTSSQAAFYIERSGGNFQDYEEEHDQFHRSLDLVYRNTSKYLKAKILEREFLSSYIFSPEQLIVIVGRDGLVANTAKYLDGNLILAVNPDEARNDGVLLPFNSANFINGLLQVQDNKAKYHKISLAEVKLNDGQSLMAFNDFYIGAKTHVSSRYLLRHAGKEERHSSSGILVSTGAGSTGWMSSVFNMANSLQKLHAPVQKMASKSLKKIKAPSKSSSDPTISPRKMNWETEELFFVVREPFRSKITGINLTAGYIQKGKTLEIESLMPDYGVIFSDGVEDDYLSFNAGAIANIGLADKKANLVKRT